MEEKTPSSRKAIRVAILFLILVVLPAGSWFYLRGGLNWRKQAQDELKDGYGQVRSAPIIWPDGTKDDLLKSKVCVIHYFGDNPDLTDTNRKIIDIGEKLVDQFGFKPGMPEDHFRLVMVASGQTSEFKSHYQVKPNAEKVNWVWTGAMGSWKTILVNGYSAFCQKNGTSPVPEYFALADTSGAIRRFYNALDDKEVGRMVEHIALLMPRQ